VTWHYRNADHELGIAKAQQCHGEIYASVAQKYDIEIMTGKMNLEVRPKFINKGEIAKRLMSDNVGVSFDYLRADASSGERQASTTKGRDTGTEAASIDLQNIDVGTRAVESQFIFCVGDDSTDEDMFRAMQYFPSPAESKFAVTVGTGSKQTLAEWHVLEPNDVIDVVEGLLG
jgi:trehalose 6-phosphate synthase/phosphatase